MIVGLGGDDVALAIDSYTAEELLLGDIDGDNSRRPAPAGRQHDDEKLCVYLYERTMRRRLLLSTLLYWRSAASSKRALFVFNSWLVVDSDGGGTCV